MIKRFGSVILKVLVALCGVAIIFGIATLIYQGSAHIMSAIKLYWDVAKNNVVESVVFYAMLAIAVFAIEMIVNGVKKKKKKDE